MTPFGLAGLLTGITSVGFGLFILLKSPNRKVGRIWFLFTLAVGIWGFGGVWISWAKTAPEGLLAWRLVYAFGVMWIAALFYHFVCTFLDLRRSRSIALHYFISFLFLLTLPTPLFFTRVRWAFDSIYYVLGGALYPVYFAWWLSLVLFGHYELIRAHHTASPARKNQIKYVFLATAIGYSGGSTAYFAAFNIDIYPWGNFAMVLHPLIMSYAILNYKLMDISLIIRKTLIYSVVMSTLTLVYLSTAYVITRLIGGWFGSNPALSYGIAASLVAVLFDPLRSRVQTFVDQRFFRDTGNRERKLLELSMDIFQEKNPQSLASALSQILEEAFHPKQIALYLRSPGGKEFERLTPGGAETKTMPEGNAWARHFSTAIDPVVSTSSAPIAKELQRMEMVLALPLLSQGELLGYVLLGEKKSEEPYTEDDLWLLRSATSQVTLAYERCLLNNELQEAPQALETMASSFVHEIKTPLSSIKMPADLLMMFLDELEAGKRSLNEMLPLLRRCAATIQAQSRTAFDKIEAIRQMSKKQTENYARLSPTEMIKNSLAALDQLIAQSGMDVTIELPESLPPIFGNAQQLGIVFMNLVKNGLEAMAHDSTSTRPKKLLLEGHAEGNFVVITVKDCGPGIKPEHITKLFNAYFSTKGSAGTGMGLFLTQEVIKSHGGTVSVQSEWGQGTAFIVKLPIDKDESRQGA